MSAHTRVTTPHVGPARTSARRSSAMRLLAPRASVRWSGTILQRLETLCRYLGLNVLWVASLLPIVTAPGGTRAMLETVHRWGEADDLPVARTFLHELRRHAVRAAWESLPVAVLIVVIAVDFGIVGAMGEQRTVLFPATLAIAIPTALFAANLQPILVGRHENTLREGYRIAFRGMVASPLAAVLTLLVVVLALLAVYIQPLLLLIVPAPAGRLVLTLHRRFTSYRFAGRAQLTRHAKENP